MNRFFTLLLAASCLTAVGQVPDYVPTDGLVGWYALDGNGIDESIAANHALGNCNWVSGNSEDPSDQAASFNGFGQVLSWYGEDVVRNDVYGVFGASIRCIKD